MARCGRTGVYCAKLLVLRSKITCWYKLVTLLVQPLGAARHCALPGPPGNGTKQPFAILQFFSAGSTLNLFSIACSGMNSMFLPNEKRSVSRAPSAYAMAIRGLICEGAVTSAAMA